MKLRAAGRGKIAFDGFGFIIIYIPVYYSRLCVECNLKLFRVSVVK